MNNLINARSNSNKSKAGQELVTYLSEIFERLRKAEIIKEFSKKQNFAHKNYEYPRQYLANFILQTLDDKFIIINSSTSFRDDRMKGQAYDLAGVRYNAGFADNIIAAILLYPNQEISNTSFKTFRKRVYSREMYSPATHVFVLDELIDFLENHKLIVEQQKQNEVIELEKLNEIENKDGSYFGIRGNDFEHTVVNELISKINLNKFQEKSSSGSNLFDIVMRKLCNDHKISLHSLINIEAKNSITKLRSGGNAKTDVLVQLNTKDGNVSETLSLKSTSQNSVSCHDYKAEDFIRVLQIEGSKLSEYILLFQEYGSHSGLQKALPNGYSINEFENLLEPYKLKLIEWALMGKHDHQNLTDPNLQVSRYILINKNGKLKFLDYQSYIGELYSNNKKLVYGLPLSWTYPSKQRGKRIQLKLPIYV